MNLEWFEIQLLTDVIDYFVGIAIASVCYVIFKYVKNIIGKKDE